MSKQRACIKCGEPATVTFGNDPDLKGVPACDKCKQNVQLALLMALTGEMTFEKALQKLK